MQTLSRAADRSSLAARVRSFFYDSEAPYGLALTRMLLPLPLMATMLQRWAWARELFSTDGATTPLWVSYGHPNALPEFSGTVAVILVTVLIIALGTLAVGWCTRASAVICFTLYTYITCLDAVSTMTKYSVIASHMLLLLAISHCGAVWSVDAWLRKRRNRKNNLPIPGNAALRFPAWPRRLMQLMIGFVYFGAAITKMHTPEYFSSDQLAAWFMSNVNNANPVGEYLTLFPAMLVLFAYIAVVWETLFLFLTWRGTARIVMLCMGVGFHVMTTLTLGLYIFPVVCIAAYFAFLNEDDIRVLALIGRRIKRRFTGVVRRRRPATTGAGSSWIDRCPVPAPVGFALLLGVSSMAAVEAEYQMDPYGQRRAEGPHELKELDTEFVEQRLLAGPTTIRPKDMVWGLKAGTVVVGGHIANPRRTFAHGEKMLVQFNVNPPHKDIWVECSLCDADENVILSQHQPIARETRRPSFPFAITGALEPGDYVLVVKSQNVKVIRHRVRIVASKNAGNAN